MKTIVVLTRRRELECSESLVASDTNKYLHQAEDGQQGTMIPANTHKTSPEQAAHKDREDRLHSLSAAHPLIILYALRLTPSALL